MVWPKIRQTEKARIFDGTALSLVYPGAIPTPLLPLIGWIFEKVVDSINGSRGETELCSFVYFIYVTICLVYVKKKESKNQFFLFWGTSSCRSRSGFVRCNESVATDTSLPSTLQAAPGPLAGNLMSHNVRSAGDFRNAPSDGLRKQMWNVAQKTLDNALDADFACTAEQQRHTAQTPSTKRTEEK